MLTPDLESRGIYDTSGLQTSIIIVFMSDCTVIEKHLKGCDTKRWIYEMVASCNEGTLLVLSMLFIYSKTKMINGCKAIIEFAENGILH